MTDYAAMPAGQELDAEVYEKVMGERARWMVYTTDPPTTELVGVPHYSTDIAAAWPILDKFLEATIDKLPSREGGQWRASVELVRTSTWHPVGVARAETAPLAICRAALVAVGTKSLTHWRPRFQACLTDMFAVKRGRPTT